MKMARKWQGAAAIALLLVAATVAEAGEGGRTDRMLENCQSVNRENEPGHSWYDSGVCLGWISGVQDVTIMAGYFGDSVGKAIGCPDGSVTVGQMPRIFVRYAETHPELHHRKDLYTLMKAMREAFPCEEQ